MRRTMRPGGMDRAAFVARFGGVFERSPWIAGAAWDAGLPADADTAEGLHAAMLAVLRAAPRERQLDLLNAHPDLAGKLAVRGELTPESSAEQAGAGLDRCTPAEFTRFTELNDAYKARFGFPFILAVKGRTRADILAAFERRVHNTPEEEFATALAQVERIALLRLKDLMGETVAMANDAQQTIRDTLAGWRDEQGRFLAELVKVPSDSPPGDCARHAERAAELLEAMGFTVERHRVPDDVVRAAGMVSATNLVVRRRFGDGPVVALNAHGDVVPPGEGWTRDPYGAEIVDGWMVGRGAAVSKSDFATYAFALRALEAAVPARGTVELHLTYDEESGGEIGPKWLLEQGISKPDLAIAAGFSYAVVTAHNGCLHLEVEVNGRSAHAALPATGIDALEAATAVLNALYAHRAGFAATVSAVPGIGSPQLTVGLIKGGINTNVVPDRVTLRLDRRMIPEEDPAEVERNLRAVIAGAASAFPAVRVEVRRILLAEPLKPLPDTGRLAEVLCRHASRVMGEPVVAKGVPLYTDARHYAAAGVPIVLYGAGPRSIEEANAHRADERLPLSDLHKATEVVALALRELLTG